MKIVITISYHTTYRRLTCFEKLVVFWCRCCEKGKKERKTVYPKDFQFKALKKGAELAIIVKGTKY